MITNLKNLTIVNPNYIACLMWKDQHGRTYRYALWSDVGETRPLGFPLYTGQLIKKNFRIEIWSIDGQNITETVGDNLITSVLQGIDYRYGNDGPLSGESGQITEFSCHTSTTDNYPVDIQQIAIGARWVGTNLTQGQLWHSVEGLDRTMSGINPIVDNTLATNPVGNFTENNSKIALFVANPQASPFHMWHIIKFISAVDGYIYNFTGDGQFVAISPGPSNNVTLTMEDGNTTDVPLNEWIILEVGYGATIGTSFIRYFSLTALQSYTSPSGQATTTVPVVQNGVSYSNFNSVYYIAEINIFNAYLDPTLGQELLTYFYNKYAFYFALPLTFPANSTPAPNTI